MSIKPIETVYNGYKFRSRLEARWAVFFDAIRLKYQYEPEGFEVTVHTSVFPDVDEETTYRYLPDFYFPDAKCYGEVKANLTGLKSDEEKIAYCIDWDRTPISNGLIILGQIPYWDDDKFEIPLFPYLYCRKGIILTHAYFLPNSGWKEFAPSNIYLSFDAWNDCSSAPDFPESINYFSEDLYKLGYRTSVEVAGRCYDMDQQDKIYSSIELRDAFLKARQARFEHGETPII